MSNVSNIAMVGSGIAVLSIDHPPVNAIGAAVRKGLLDGFAALSADPAVRAVVVICEGRTFFAGADISEFGKPPVAPSLSEVLAGIENCPKPVVAAIHGAALGGGYELALVCSHRIAVPSASIGLPEVKLGTLPGGGGTQRLPRLVGVAQALEIIAKGDPVPAPRALELGMIDALAAEGSLRDDAVAFAARILAEGEPLRPVRNRDEKLAPYRGDSALFDAFLKANAKAFRGLKAPLAIVESIRNAVELPFEEGIARERALFQELNAGTQSQALRYYFFAERSAGKVPGIDAATKRLPINSVGVIGAGTMGGGIAMNFVNAGIPVTLVETSQEALDRGLGVIRRNYETSASRGRLTMVQVEERMALITPALSLDALGEVDLVIEAVFEELKVKQDIFARLGQVARPDALLASNTSYLDLDQIAAVTGRPQDVLGLHFFSPANVMRLLEVVCGEKTRSEAIATGFDLARRIGKVPVYSRVGYGFIANRVMSVRGKAAERLVLEGPSPQQVDKALVDYGFAVGPFQMMDIVGHDVIGRGGAERTLRGDLVALDRLGMKKNGGFYDYDENRQPVPSRVAAKVIADFAAHKGVKPGVALSDEEIVARLLYPVVNECARVVDEGVALRASDVDVACILGYNWPMFTGGPMFWADSVGLNKVIAGLKSMGEEPAALLVRTAAAGGRLTG